MLGEAGL
jgi:hypothetical protein